MRVGNPDRSPFAIQGRDATPGPTGFAESVGNDFPVFHAAIMRSYHSAGNVIETHEHAGDFKEPWRVKQKAATR
jgi:hypothetical protein